MARLNKRSELTNTCHRASMFKLKKNQNVMSSFHSHMNHARSWTSSLLLFIDFGSKGREKIASYY